MTSLLPRLPDYFLEHLRHIALAIRASVANAFHVEMTELLSRAIAERGGDTIYRLDEHGEAILRTHCERWGHELPFLLIAEGLVSGEQIFPEGTSRDDLAFTLIADPIDGTRELMYSKRSAWVLLAVAPPPQPGWHPTLADVQIALQAELPTARAAVADLLYAVRGEGVQAETHDLRTGAVTPFVPHPSQATTLEGGFAAISKFFPGAKELTARLEEAIFSEVLGPPISASPQVFDDEYISTGGQLYELLIGHDRFLADLRPLLHNPREPVTRISCHPYDICTALIAEEGGVLITDATGRPLSAPLDTLTAIAWVGYANQTLRVLIEPALQRHIRALVGALDPAGNP
jgi:fructose-1,6-bisphosphatase/inositol monophosphatase family enzyme